MEHHDSCHGTFLFVCETLAHRLFHSEANPGSLRPKGQKPTPLNPDGARQRDGSEFGAETGRQRAKRVN